MPDRIPRTSVPPTLRDRIVVHVALICNGVASGLIGMFIILGQFNMLPPPPALDYLPEWVEWSDAILMVVGGTAAVYGILSRNGDLDRNLAIERFGWTLVMTAFFVFWFALVRFDANHWGDATLRFNMGLVALWRVFIINIRMKQAEAAVEAARAVKDAG